MTAFWLLLVAAAVLRPLRRWVLSFWPVTAASLVAFFVGVAAANWAEGLGITRDWPLPLSLQFCWGVIFAVLAGQWAFGALGFLCHPPIDEHPEADDGREDR